MGIWEAKNHAVKSTDFVGKTGDGGTVSQKTTAVT
jgi:hypothetical protein